MENYLEKLFIDEAKPALRRHTGSDVDTEAIRQEAHAAGISDERKRFWGKLTNYGKGHASDFRACFGGSGWTDEIFTPIYDLVLQRSCPYIFSATKIIDMIKCFEDQGTRLDTSAVTSMNNAFSFAYTKRIPYLDLSSISDTATTIFDGARAEFIEGIKFSEATKYSNIFRSATYLQTMPVSGTIGQNGFDVKWSTLLDRDSLLSILNALKDYSTDTSGTVWVVTFGTENLAKLTEEELAIAAEKGWEVQ